MRVGALHLISELGLLEGKVQVLLDSQSGIQLCKNPVFHDRTKHIDVRFHFIRDLVEQGIISLEKIQSELNPADMGTKCLPLEKFQFCTKCLNIDTLALSNHWTWLPQIRVNLVGFGFSSHVHICPSFNSFLLYFVCIVVFFVCCTRRIQTLVIASFEFSDGRSHWQVAYAICSHWSGKGL